jgi:hypothetical protein
MKKHIVKAVVLLITLAIGWLVGFSWRPSYPESWNKITLGMSASETRQYEPRLSSEMRDLKGFDQFAIDFGDRAWILVVSLDEKTNVSSVSKMYVFKPCGLWNKTILQSRK